MDLFQKIETLISAKARSVLPRRRRRSPVEEQEAQLLAEIREVLAKVEAQERALAERLKAEQARAAAAAERGDRAQQRDHERRSRELERELQQESVRAIDIEGKLKALEAKLARAQEAVDRQRAEAVRRDEAAEAAMAHGGASQTTPAPPAPAEPEVIPDDFADDDPETAARKSRLSGG